MPEQPAAPGAILDGLRVVEASAFVAAPLGGMTLGQMGADVIRIDPPGGGLDMRRWPVTSDNVSLFWCGLNKSKRSVVLDLSRPEGRELAMALICAPGKDAGLLLTNFPARGFLDYETLTKRRHDLIQLTITGDRQGGSAVDYTINPRMGLPFLTGPADAAQVVNHVLPAWDLITGNMAVSALLAAERHRNRTNQGQHMRLALEEAALAVMGHLGFIAQAQLGQVRERVGNDLYGAFGRDFLTQDGVRIMVVGLTPKQWQGLCQATGLQDEMLQLAQDLKLDFRREGDRFMARDAIADLLGAWLLQHDLSDIAPAFNAHGVCWSIYQTVTQLVAHDPACSTENPMFAQVTQPGVGGYLTPGLPVSFSGFKRNPPRPAPNLGQHTEEVMIELLGLSSAQFGHLMDQGIVESAAHAK